MTLLRSFRNLAVLAIVTVAGLTLNSRLVAAESSCIPLGGEGCVEINQCCAGFCYHRKCCLLFHNEYCTTSADCCSGACVDHHC